MSTIKQLRDDALNMIELVKSKKMDRQVANTIVGLNKTIISSAKLEFEYNKHHNPDKKIDFLES